MNEQAVRDAMSEGCPFGNYESVSQVETTVRWYITNAMKMHGQQNADEDLMYTITRKISDTIIRDYPSMTDKEFEIMLDAGVSGELCKDTWVNGASILQWLRLYSQHQTRISVIDSNEEVEKESHRKTKEEIYELNRQACDNKIHEVFAFYKENGDIFDDKNHDPRAFATPQFAGVVYQWFRDEGKIPEPDADDVREAKEYANRRISERNIRTEYIPSAMADWQNSYLLIKYFESVLKPKS